MKMLTINSRLVLFINNLKLKQYTSKNWNELKIFIFKEKERGRAINNFIIIITIAYKLKKD